MTRSRKILSLVIAFAVLVCVIWLFRRSRAAVSPSPIASSAVPVAGTGGEGGGAQDDPTPTTLYAHNLRLIKGPTFRVYVRWIRGEMLRTNPKINPSFDAPDSFVLGIQKGVIRVNIGDIAGLLNNSLPADAPFKNISVEPFGDQVKLHGTVHKLMVPLPVELTGELSPLANGRVRFHLLKLNVLKLPVKSLLGSLNLQLVDLVHSAKMPGVEIAGNNIDFDTQKLLPPPHIRGQITSVRVATPDIEVIYGNSSNDEATLSQWRNFFRLEGGSLDFGKLTMRKTDLTMIDSEQEPWFDLDLVHYQAQLVNGYIRMTPQAGLEIFMPGSNEKAPGASKTISLPWLKDRNRSLPADVPHAK